MFILLYVIVPTKYIRLPFSLEITNFLFLRYKQRNNVHHHLSDRKSLQSNKLLVKMLYNNDFFIRKRNAKYLLSNVIMGIKRLIILL